MQSYAWWRSTTVLGALFAAGARVMTDHSLTSIAESIGIVIAAFGARNAIAKNGEGK